MKKNNLQQVVDEAKAIIAKKDEAIVLLKKKVREANGEKSVVFKMPDTMEVANFPTIQKVHIENQKAVQDVNVLNLKRIEVEVKNHPDVQKVEVINGEKAPEVQKVEITNQEKASAWVPSMIVSSVKSVGDLFIKLWGNGLTVRLAEEERLKPIPVYLVDKDGRPIKDAQGNQKVIHGLNLPMIGRGNQSFAPLTAVVAASLDQYKISDGDEATTTKYYGFIDADGNWYIMKNDTTANTYRYAKGSSAYTTNWTNRASLTYDYFNVVF